MALWGVKLGNIEQVLGEVELRWQDLAKAEKVTEFST
jgi:hypothetical protein